VTRMKLSFHFDLAVDRGFLLISSRRMLNLKEKHCCDVTRFDLCLGSHAGPIWSHISKTINRGNIGK